LQRRRRRLQPGLENAAAGLPDARPAHDAAKALIESILGGDPENGKRVFRRTNIRKTHVWRAKPMAIECRGSVSGAASGPS
jgi:hypothetical protein